MEQETTLEMIRREFRGLRRLAEGAIAQLDETGWFRTLGEEENSVAILMKHLSGNMLSRWRDFLESDGEKPDRDRESEFGTTPQDTREALLQRWERGWQSLFDAIGGLTEDDLDRTVRIRGEPHTVRQALHRQLTHYGYHVGQIVFLARHLVGASWRSLSIPRGRSQAFNQEPRSYLGGSGES